MTWNELIRYEPRLLTLLNEARAQRANGRYCANYFWYTVLKDKVVDLVGHVRRDHAVLGTSAAYDIAYETIYEALPDCRGCQCEPI